MHLDWYKMYLLLVSLFAVANGQFLESPTNKTISVGEIAQYRCRHTSAIFITWKINETMIEDDNDLPPGITRDLTIEGGGVVYILRILGRPEYNTTTVVGVAMISNGLNETTSPTAILQVSMNTTDENIHGFIEEPRSLNVTNGQKATFHCEHDSADSILWRINGTLLNDLRDLHADFIGRFTTLTVTARPEYNATVVQCVTQFTSDVSQQEVTPDAILLIQGLLDPITDHNKQNSILYWKAPFSLDLTNVEPDIVYCVDVYNITCGGRELLISDCDVTETSYTSDVIAPDGYIYEYIVTPRSNVEGALNGTPSQPLRDNLPTFTESSTRVSVGNFGQDSNVRDYQIELTYTSNDPIPSFYSLSLQSLDGLEDMDHVETTATVEPSVLTLEVVSGLPFRRLWNCTVLAYGCQENNIVNDVLSTYNFRNILSSSLHPGEVRVTGRFTDDSTATGVLVIVIGDSEVIYHKASRDGTDKIKETLITGLAGGEYSISVFVVEENGLPFERVATSPKLVAVETNDVVTPPSSSIEYSLQSTSTGVCITCTFLDSSATDCVAVVHQRISQLSSSGLMNIESSHKLTRSGDTASGCIEGVNMEDYQVGVFEERPVITVSEKTSCAVCVSVGSVIAVIMSVLASVVLVLIILVSIRTKRRKEHLRVSVHNTTINHDTESGHGNEYEKCPLDKKEEIFVEIDGEITRPHLFSEDAYSVAESESVIGLHQTSAPAVPPVPQRAHTVDRSQPVYVKTFTTQVNDVPAPPMVDRQEYDQVTGFKNPEGLHYAIVHPKTKPQKTPLDDVRDRVVYSELMPQVIMDVVVDDSIERDNHPQLAIGNVNGNISDIRSIDGTSTSVTGEGMPFCEYATCPTNYCQGFFTQLGTDEPKQQNTQQSVQSDGFYPQPLFEPATCFTNCHQGFFTPLGTEEPQQQNTQQSVQSEHEDDCYMSAVMSTLKVSHHVQMPKEEQQRLLRCTPASQECLWQEKASLTDQNLSVVNRAHHPHEKPCSVKVSSVATLDSACVGQGWLPDLLESVVKLASNLPVQLSRFKC